MKNLRALMAIASAAALAGPGGIVSPTSKVDYDAPPFGPSRRKGKYRKHYTTKPPPESSEDARKRKKAERKRKAAGRKKR